MSLSLIALLVAAFSARVNAQCQEIAGNYYCASTDAIIYNNVGFSGTYNEITSMDSTSCACSSSPQAFSGGLAPLNDEISLHLRGPIQIGQIAVYHRTSASKEKRDAEPEPEPDFHGHGQPFQALARHKRGHNHRHERRGNAVVTVTETAYVTSTRHLGSNGTTTATGVPPPAVNNVVAPSDAPAPAATGSFSWTRDSYYNAATGEQDNLVFLNHLGGTNGSGSWDSCFGNTLSYANCDGVTAAGVPTVLDNVLIPSDQEIVAFTNVACDSSCGYVRPGTPAYKGFSTSSDVVFLLEFMMPRDSSSGFNVDMSAAWFLNAQIPRTLQYGNAACSCWTSGCGEWDVFEILSTGSDFLTSTLHTWQGTGTQYGGGGCSDYIERPLTTYMQAAIIMSVEDMTMSIVVIEPIGDFGAGLDDSQVSSWCATAGSDVSIA